MFGQAATRLRSALKWQDNHPTLRKLRIKLNHDHAVLIPERFDKNYPQCKGAFAPVIDFQVQAPSVRAQHRRVKLESYKRPVFWGYGDFGCPKRFLGTSCAQGRRSRGAAYII